MSQRSLTTLLQCHNSYKWTRVVSRLSSQTLIRKLTRSPEILWFPCRESPVMQWLAASQPCISMQTSSKQTSLQRWWLRFMRDRLSIRSHGSGSSPSTHFLCLQHLRAPSVSSQTSPAPFSKELRRPASSWDSCQHQSITYQSSWRLTSHKV